MLKSPAGRPQATAAAAPAPPAAARLVDRSSGSVELTARRVMVRLAFSRLLLGGLQEWAFVCDGQQAEDLAEAVMQRRPVRLVFPDNTVIVDGAEVGVADFQHLLAADEA